MPWSTVLSFTTLSRTEANVCHCQSGMLRVTVSQACCVSLSVRHVACHCQSGMLCVTVSQACCVSLSVRHVACHCQSGMLCIKGDELKK